MSRALLDKAILKRTTTTVAGETITVREPSALEAMEYRERLSSPDPDAKLAAYAYLVQLCVLTDDGTQAYTQAEALQIAGGSQDVFVPLIFAITGFITDRAKKKSDAA